MRITLLPFQSVSHGVDAHLLEHLSGDLEESLGLETGIAAPHFIPARAYNPQRNQYRAESLLAELQPQPDERLLGITSCDLYFDDYHFVFGLARQDNAAAVISLARLLLDGDAELQRQRILKAALHELGHTFGLGHCPDRRCVMHFSNCLADTDYKHSGFCHDCRQRLSAPQG